MTNLTRRDEKQQKLDNQISHTRAQRDEAMTRLVRLETKVRTLEKSAANFRESTKRIRARMLAEESANRPVIARVRKKTKPDVEIEPHPDLAHISDMGSKTPAQLTELVKRERSDDEKKADAAKLRESLRGERGRKRAALDA